MCYTYVEINKREKNSAEGSKAMDIPSTAAAICDILIDKHRNLLDKELVWERFENFSGLTNAIIEGLKEDKKREELYKDN